MAISKQHKIYIGVVSVAVIGLVLDRTLFTPADAVATSMDEYTVDASAEPPAENTARALLAAEHSLANRLKSVSASRSADPHHVSDIFTSPWANSAEGVVSPVAAPSAAAEFRQRHRLTALMGADGGGYAVIDGKCLRIGQSIDGCVLTAVTTRTAMFHVESSGEQFEYVLPVDSGSALSRPDASVIR